MCSFWKCSNEILHKQVPYVKFSDFSKKWLLCTEHFRWTAPSGVRHRSIITAAIGPTWGNLCLRQKQIDTSEQKCKSSSKGIFLQMCFLRVGVTNYHKLQRHFLPNSDPRCPKLCQLLLYTGCCLVPGTKDLAGIHQELTPKASGRKCAVFESVQMRFSIMENLGGFHGNIIYLFNRPSFH